MKTENPLRQNNFTRISCHDHRTPGGKPRLRPHNYVLLQQHYERCHKGEDNFVENAIVRLVGSV